MSDKKTVTDPQGNEVEVTLELVKQEPDWLEVKDIPMSIRKQVGTYKGSWIGGNQGGCS